MATPFTITFDFTGNSLAATGVPAGLTVSQISAGTVGTIAPGDWTYATDPVLRCVPPSSSSSDATAKSTGCYYFFLVTPDSGVTFDLSSLGLNAARGGGSSDQRGVSVYDSVDNYGTARVVEPLAAMRPDWEAVSAPLNHTGLTTAYTLRVYYWGQGGSNQSVECDDIALSGQITSGGEPAPPPTGTYVRATSGPTFVSGGAITLTKPTGTVEGDLMLAHVQNDSSAANHPGDPTPPAGWTMVGSRAVSDASCHWYYRKVAGPSEPATYEWTNFAVNDIGGAIVTVANAHATSPIVASDVSATQTAVASTTRTVTTADADTLLVGLVGIDGNSTTTGGFTASDSMEKHYDITDVNAGYVNLAGFSGVAAVAGSHSRTFTLISGPENIGAALIAVRTGTSAVTEELETAVATATATDLVTSALISSPLGTAEAVAAAQDATAAVGVATAALETATATAEALDPSVAAVAGVTITATLVNDGWAAPVRQRPVRVVFTSGTSTVARDVAGVDMRTWLPGTHNVEWTVDPPATAGTWDVHLHFPDPSASLQTRPEYALRLANVGTWDGATGYHALGQQVTVAADGSATVSAATAVSASTDMIPNPERGWFIYTETHYQADGTGHSALDQAALTAARTGTTTLATGDYAYRTIAFRYFVIEKYLNQDTIDQAYLDLLAADFNTARAAGVKVMPRFAYSTSGDMTPPYGADPPVARVLTHIHQLAPVLNDHADVIHALQAGFIGMWGEWYYTDNFGDTGTLTAQNWADRKAVLDALLDYLDDRILLLVRYPGIKARYFA